MLTSDTMASDLLAIPSVTVEAKRTITSHLKQLSINKTTTYDFRNPCPCLGQARVFFKVTTAV